MKAVYLLGSTKLPAELNDELDREVAGLSKLNGKPAVLEAAYKIVTTKYHGHRAKTVFRLWEVFSGGWQDLWNRSGFMHCTNQNYLLTLLLIKSGWFKQSDIRRRWTLYWWLSPHQYLQVNIGKNQWVNIDAWSAAYGIKLGDYAHGFHTNKN